LEHTLLTNRALIVDDSKTACLVMEKMLLQHGIAADSCYSGLEALDYLKHHAPSVIFMDHTMPGMNGLEVVRILKESPATATIPVLMFTAKSGELYCSQARALGAIDVLPKELEQKHIVQALTQLGLMPTQIKEKENEKKLTLHEDDGLDIDIDSDLSFTSPKTIEEIVLKAISNNFKSVIRPHITERMHIGFALQNEHHKLEQNQLTTKVVKSIDTALLNYQSQLEELREDLLTQQINFEKRNPPAKWMQFLGFSLTIATIALATLMINEQETERQNAIAALLATTHPSIPYSQPDPIREPKKSEISKNTKKEKNPSEAAISPSQITADIPFDDEQKFEIKGWDEENNAFLVETRLHYTFFLTPNGQIPHLPIKIYFLEKNCFGDSYIEPNNGTVFKGFNEQLWYSSQEEPQQSIQPMSVSVKDGDCQNYDGTSIDAKMMQENQVRLTGVEDKEYPINFNLINL